MRILLVLALAGALALLAAPAQAYYVFSCVEPDGQPPQCTTAGAPAPGDTCKQWNLRPPGYLFYGVACAP